MDTSEFGHEECVVRADGVNGEVPPRAPAAFRRSLKKYLANSAASLKRVGLRCQVSTFDPCLYLWEDFTCGEPKIRDFSEQLLGIAIAGVPLCSCGNGIGTGL